MNRIADINEANIAAFQQLLEGCRRFVVTVHNSPDGDALGSGTALCHYLASRGKAVSFVLPDPAPGTLSFLFREDDPFAVFNLEDHPDRSRQAIADADSVICLDFNAFHRTKLGPVIAGSRARKVLIDHHIGPDRKAFELSFSEEKVSSASELLYYILLESDDIRGDASALPPRSAYALLTGMTTDTNNFGNSVWPSTLKMASDLIAAGVDRDGIIDHIYHAYRENRLRALGFFLSEKMKLTPQGVAYVVFSEQDMQCFGLQEGETEGFVNFPLSLQAVNVSVFLREMPDRFRVSVRSRKGWSANRWARECFFGGGHENAAGGTLFKAGTPDHVRGGIPETVTDAASVEQYVQDAIVRFFGTV